MLFTPWFYKRTQITSSSTLTKLMLIPFGFCVNVGLNNISLMYATLALNQLIRSFAPVTTALASYFMEGKKYTMIHTFLLFSLSFGIALGVSASPDYNFLGVLICLSSVFGTTTQFVLTSYFMGGQNVKLHPLDVLLYTSLPSVVLLIPMAIAVGDFEHIIEAFNTHGHYKFAVLIAFGGCLAFTYNLTVILLIKYTSAVYITVAGSFKVVLIIALSFAFFNQRMTMLSGIGVSIACLAFVGNSYIQFNKKKTTSEVKGIEIKKLKTDDKHKADSPVDSEDEIESAHSPPLSKSPSSEKSLTTLSHGDSRGNRSPVVVHAV